jgi:hypothetical protein
MKTEIYVARGMGLELSAIAFNRRVAKRYFGYTLREAKKLFRAHLLTLKG